MSTWSSWSLTSTMSMKRPGPLVSGCAVALAAATRATSSAAQYRVRQWVRLVLERGICDPVIRPRHGFGDRAERRIAVHVAGAGAITQLGRRVLHSAPGLRMQIWFEIAGVAAGTASSLRGRAPGDLVGVGRMTARAHQGRAVLARIGGPGAPGMQHRPVRIAVAGGAVARHDHVRGRHTQRNAVVVATGAGGRP